MTLLIDFQQRSPQMAGIHICYLRHCKRLHEGHVTLNITQLWFHDANVAGEHYQIPIWILEHAGGLLELDLFGQARLQHDLQSVCLTTCSPRARLWIWLFHDFGQGTTNQQTSF